MHTMHIKTSESMRADPLFMRNAYEGQGKWGMPIVRKQRICLDNVSLIACSDTRPHDTSTNTSRGVHFFVDDYRFDGIYRNPAKSLNKYSQYAFLLTPDYSTYADMQPWRQLESVAHSRWCGAYWQSNGLTVLVTVTWGGPNSYDYCFDGIETGAIVAVGMIGCKMNKKAFLHGYDAMIERLSPEAVICFGNPFPEMRGNLITVDYRSSRKAVR